MQICQWCYVGIFERAILPHFKQFRLIHPCKEVFIDLQIIVSGKHSLDLFFKEIPFGSRHRESVLYFHHIENIIRHSLKPLAHGVAVETVELLFDKFSRDGDVFRQLHIFCSKVVVFDVQNEAIQTGDEIERGFILDSFNKVRCWFCQQFIHLLKKAKVFVFVIQYFGKYLLHTGFGYGFFTQFGQDVRDVIGKHLVRRNNQYVF